MVGQSKLIAIIDDNEQNLLGLSLALEDAGFRAVTGKDAAEVMVKLREQGDSLTAVVTDYHLIDSTGVEVIKAIEQQIGYAAPAVIVSGTSRPSRIKAELSELGLAERIEVFSKPVDPDTLIDHLIASID